MVLALNILCPYIVKCNFSQYFETGEIATNLGPENIYLGSIPTL